MTKALLLSVALGLVVFPILASRDPHPQRGLKKAVLWVLSFNLFFVFFLRVVIPRLG